MKPIELIVFNSVEELQAEAKKREAADEERVKALIAQHGEDCGNLIHFLALLMVHYKLQVQMLDIDPRLVSGVTSPLAHAMALIEKITGKEAKTLHDAVLALAETRSMHFTVRPGGMPKVDPSKVN